MAELSKDAAAEAGKRYWREADARVWVDAWRQSGQSQAEFARKHGIGVERLARWARRLRGAVPAQESGEFHPVRVRPRRAAHGGSDERIELELGEGGSIVRLPHGFDGADLRRVLEVLAGSA